MTSHEDYMGLALRHARRAERRGEVPIGAVLVCGGEVLASGYNRPIEACDPSAHAEIVALRRAARRTGNYRLVGCTMYVTLEPCLMCVGALLNARVSALVYGADEPKFGAVRSILQLSDLRLTHRFPVTAGVLEPECRQVLVDFFRTRRQQV